MHLKKSALSYMHFRYFSQFIFYCFAMQNFKKISQMGQYLYFMALILSNS